MTITSLLSADRIFINHPVSSKKKLLEHIADTAAIEAKDQNSIFCNLLDRERLGSTGIGHGFAIPHARMTDLKTTLGIFIKLEKPINFESIDREPVDIVFAIIIPEDATEEHLHILSSLASIFSQSGVGDAIRSAESSEQILNIIESAEK